MIRGRDFSQIPCFRDSCLHGIYGGLAALLITVMATSRPRLAADFGIGTFVLVTTGSFVFCRHQREKTEEIIKNITKAEEEI